MIYSSSPEYDGVLIRPISYTAKVATCVKRAEIWPVPIKASIILKGIHANVALTHQVYPQHLDAMVCRNSALAYFFTM